MENELKELIIYIENRQQVVKNEYPKSMAFDDIVFVKDRLKKKLFPIKEN